MSKEINSLEQSSEKFLNCLDTRAPLQDSVGTIKILGGLLGQ